MKKIYLLLILAFACATSTFAQSADLEIFRLVANVSKGQSLHIMTNADTIVINPTTPVEYAFTYAFVNLGSYTLTSTDTIVLNSFLYGKVSVYSTSTFAPNDTVFLRPDTVSFDTTATAGLHTICDSIWAKHSNNTVINDPNINNNKICTNTDIVKFKVGIEEINNYSSTLSVYPNPATSNINIKYNFTGGSKATLSIFDVVGRKVYETEISDLSGEKTIPVNVSSYAPGIYMAVLNVDDNKVVAKFNVQK